MSTEEKNTSTTTDTYIVDITPDDSSTLGQSTSAAPGYTGLADFIGSDRDHFIFRRFDTLAARNLLYIQDELSELEEKLHLIDQAGIDSGNPSISRRHDTNSERKAIMKEIGGRLEAYQKALLAQSSILALTPAPFKISQSLRDYIHETTPIPQTESRFLNNQHDLISLTRPSLKDPIESFLEKRWSQKLLTTKDANTPQDPSPAHIYRNARLITALTAVFILMAPVTALYHVTEHPSIKLPLMAVFGFVFSAILAMWTQSRNSEIFMAMAAYLAVLVVFMGTTITTGRGW